MSQKNGGNMSNKTDSINNKKPVGKIILAIVVGLLFVLAVALISISVWYKKNYNMAFNELIFVLTGPIEGTGSNMINDILLAVLPSSIISAVAYAGVTVFLFLGKEKIFKILKLVGLGVCSATLVFSLIFTTIAFQLTSIFITLEKTDIYEKYYINPDDVAITKGENAKNVLYIYLESMETAHADKESGGSLNKNYIPNLTQLALENTNFTHHSSTSKLGGFIALKGSGWTIAGILSSTGGIPFAFKVGENKMNQVDSFAPVLTTFGDILKANGYDNYFLCGSDAVFGGRENYFNTHGDYTIYDLYTAREEGYIEPDYHDGWWGYEDHYLYDIAKDKLTEIYEKGDPFNFTMLTVDTHPREGHGCKLCGNANDAAKVLPCADNQIKEFIDWCKQQPFYEDTVIIITGDHLRSDSALIKSVGLDDRRVYHTILNSDTVIADGADVGRLWCTFDMFPTVLASMGFTIEGERLGFGTNMYSGKKTLLEELGFDEFSTEIQKSSDFYTRHFILNAEFEKKN